MSHRNYRKRPWDISDMMRIKVTDLAQWNQTGPRNTVIQLHKKQAMIEVQCNSEFILGSLDYRVKELSCPFRWVIGLLGYHLSEWLGPSEAMSCPIDYSSRIFCHPQMSEALKLLSFKGGGSGDYNKSIIKTQSLASSFCTESFVPSLVTLRTTPVTAKLWDKTANTKTFLKHQRPWNNKATVLYV